RESTSRSHHILFSKSRTLGTSGSLLRRRRRMKGEKLERRILSPPHLSMRVAVSWTKGPQGTRSALSSILSAIFVSRLRASASLRVGIECPSLGGSFWISARVSRLKEVGASRSGE